ncbi:hypothetical protein FNV43_RR24978 [Rhamnella rubrinervis]|uniref:Protein kinase domain-containing protein n=1 Tax=Rhamnella rubrinervis TaxID=2594499 RepID=A0A8K0DU82_9ROSA|nr:hypothetical protein FNV43_RR24978 [Rhamnella rubrinervis]
MKTRRTPLSSPTTSIKAEFLVLKVILIFHQTSYAIAKHNRLDCPPSSCGHVTNISHPFRLQTDPQHCGDKRYTLSCHNNLTVLNLCSATYYVQAINYNNYTIRVVDSNIVRKGDCSSLPRSSLTSDDFTYDANHLYSTYISHKLSTRDDKFQKESLSEPVIFLKCEIPVKSALYIPTNSSTTSTCINSSGSTSIGINMQSKLGQYSYVKIGSTNVSELEDSCRIELIVMTSFGRMEKKNISFPQVIQNELAYGFELSWVPSFAEACYKYAADTCYVIDSINKVYCAPSADFSGLISFDQCGIFLTFYSASIIVPVWLIAKHLLGTPLVIAFLIYKWRRRHLSMYIAIEEFLQANNNLMHIRYSNSDIKKMTKGFKDKLGEGGFGKVYKGKLRSGHLVAVKLLGESKGDGQDFMNEVATIGRIHHVNVVQLVGFCIEGTKRALVYDFMPNGSLDKYIFSQEGKNILDCKKMCEISLGVARGIEYLHRGCNMQILHFDIKPHNILLDENFIPKVSDFGLARLYPLDNSIVSLTAARGTLGYIAPELFYKNIGRVSHKADVYSFGMLLMEMASRRKNSNAAAEHSSEIYFPTYVYGKIIKGKEVEMEDETEEESRIRKKMMMVALWCIQMKPSDRPSMNRVIAMLEGEVGCLQMPQRPFLFPQEKPVEESNSTYSSSAISDDESDEISLISNEN